MEKKKKRQGLPVLYEIKPDNSTLSPEFIKRLEEDAEAIKKANDAMNKAIKRKKGGKINKKPRGCGAAQRGFGKAMMCGGHMKGKK